MEISAELSIRIRVEMVLQRSGVQKFIGVVGTDLSMPMTAAHIQGSVQVVALAQKKGAEAPGLADPAPRLLGDPATFLARKRLRWRCQLTDPGHAFTSGTVHIGVVD